MEFPFGHHGHHHRRDEDEDEAPRFPPTGSHNPYPPRPEFDAPPPPFTDNIHGGPPGYPPAQHRPNYDAPPPPQFGQIVYGAPGYPPAQHRPNYDAPPPPQYGENVYGAPGFPPAQHGYDAPPQPSFGHPVEQHHHRLPFSSHPVEHVGHESWGGGGRGGGAGSGIPQQTVRVFTKAKEDFALSIREGNVVLAPANPRDEYQHWIKDMRYSTKVKDEEGLPSFALVNKVTGEAIKHAIKATHPVRLVSYKPDYLDESVLWTESKDTGENFRCIRMVNNIRLNFDAFHGDEDSGGVHDGTAVVLWEWKQGKNQRWKIVPY